MQKKKKLYSAQERVRERVGGKGVKNGERMETKTNLKMEKNKKNMIIMKM